MLLIHKNVTVPRLAILKVHHDFISIFHRPLLHPRLDLLVGGELQHFLNLARCANGTTADLDAVGNQSECVHWWEVAAIRSTVN